MARIALIVFGLGLAAQQADFERLYRDALEQRERTLGKDAPKTRESARDLALYLALRGDYNEASAYLELAIELADTADGATALHNWAVNVEDRDPSLAERLYRKALVIRQRALPPLNAELATTQMNLAALLISRNEADEAGKLAAAALRTFEKTLGPQNERTGSACGVLGAALAIRGDIVNAEHLFRRALSIAEKAHGPKTIQTASALENLADLLTQTGRELAGRPLLQRAKAIRAGAR